MGVHRRRDMKPEVVGAHQALLHSEEVVRLLEDALTLMTEDDPIQPTIKHLYAALCEAEVRKKVLLEDWYERTYVRSARKSL
jgi:hypothetical protein